MSAKPIVVAVVVAAVISLAVLAGGLTMRAQDDPGPNDLVETANSFPVPLGTATAFPDTSTDDVATKGWRAAGTIDEACTQWRELFRNWVENSSIGSVTGDNVSGQRCTLSGPKSGHRAELALTVYGEDPTPSVTLTIRR